MAKVATAIFYVLFIVLSMFGTCLYVCLMESINIYEAIKEMRRLSAAGRSFSMIHATYNYDTGEANGKRYVRKARLRPQAKADDIIHADHKLCYYDLDAQQPRNCWQILILVFNGMKVIL